MLTWDELLPEDGRRQGWVVPFPQTAGFDPSWWVKPAKFGHRYISIWDGDDEVARVDLNDRPLLDEWVRLPEDAVQIQFIAVQNRLWRNGIGSDVVDLIAEHHPGQALAALSAQDALGFWEKLRWERYDHRSEPELRQTLFVGPVGRRSRSGRRR